ncbi:MAG TPA: hypothetical protein VJ756_18945 [Terriglobales bacterium]|nr:hypothetical protein [Terriglobales bacterium]
MRVRTSLAACILFFLLNPSFLTSQQHPTESVTAPVPRLMRFSGVVRNGGASQTGVAGVTFLLYKSQEGGAPLWIETQNVKIDSTGHYTAFIGSTKTDGLPIELFSSGEARWLGVQVEGQLEQPRVLLLSVPYALKAADAETLGGKPASAFSLADPVQSGFSATPTGPKPTSSENTVTGRSRGTAGFIARWTSSRTLGNAILFFQDASGRVGIGTTTPLSLLHVNGLTQVGLGTATPTAVLTATSISSTYAGITATGFHGVDLVTGRGTGTDGIDAFGGGGAGGTAQGGNGVVGIGGDGNTPSSVGGTGLVGHGGVGSSPGLGVAGFGADGGGIGVVGNGGFGDPSGGPGVFGMGGPAFPGGGGTDGDGVFGSSDGSTSGFAGNFNGDLNVSGTIFAGTKDFRIDHPLDPANKYLLHASVESSEMMDVYSGNAILDRGGQATVQLPPWFEVVNTDFRYQLTSVGVPSPGLYVAKEIANHQFTIAGGTPGGKVSWQISAVRNDPYAKANPLVVEQAKRPRERGYYIHPKLYGASEEKSIEWARHPYAMRKMKEFRMKQSSRKGRVAP